MSPTPDLPERDRDVVKELQRLPAGSTIGERFTQALALGATPALLEQIALKGYLTRDPHNERTFVGLPYVAAMLDAGVSLAEVRAFVTTMCFKRRRRHEDASHRAAFWNDPGAWAIFETADQLREFMWRMAERDPQLILNPNGYIKILESLRRFGRDERQSLTDMQLVELVAAQQILELEDEYQLGALTRLAANLQWRRQIALATRLHPVGWNLVFIGYILTKFRWREQEIDEIYFRLNRQIMKYHHQAPLTYRWLAEGFRRADPANWRLNLGDSRIPGLLEVHGWYILRVSALDSALQVELPNDGNPRILIQHIPGVEELRAGDEVIVSPSLLSDSQIVCALPASTKIYRLSLIPARPPTTEMLVDSRKYFYDGARKRPV